MPKILPHNVEIFDHDAEDRMEAEAWARHFRAHVGGGIIIVLYHRNWDVTYLDDAGSPADFGDPTRAEEPLTYVRLGPAVRRLRWAMGRFPSVTSATLAFWRHPSLVEPLDKYLKMDGCRFPGSPRR